MVEHKSLREIQQAFWREIKLLGVYKNMKACILEDNLEGQRW